MHTTSAGYMIRKLADAPRVPCPCGVSTRPLTAADGAPCSLHVTAIRDSPFGTTTGQLLGVRGSAHSHKRYGIARDGVDGPLPPVGRIELPWLPHFRPVATNLHSMLCTTARIDSASPAVRPLVGPGLPRDLGLDNGQLQVQHRPVVLLHHSGPVGAVLLQFLDTLLQRRQFRLCLLLCSGRGQVGVAVRQRRVFLVEALDLGIKV